MNWFMVVLAVAAALVTLVVAGPALAKYSTLRFPWIIATAVAALVFVSLLNLGEQWAKVILLPYAAMGLTLLVMVIYLAFARGKGSRTKGRDSWKE